MFGVYPECFTVNLLPLALVLFLQLPDSSFFTSEAVSKVLYTFFIFQPNNNLTLILMIEASNVVYSLLYVMLQMMIFLGAFVIRHKPCFNVLVLKIVF